MPLLKKKTLEKAQADEFLRDDEEVFHCVMTNEIFRDYDEFAERTILCNSMVWTCSMTGKTNLTYEEALQSEQNARQMLTEFPQELHIPILYIATCVKACFTDMVEDVYNFVKDHFFIGEIVEANVDGKWKTYTVTKVIAPSEKELAEKNKSKVPDEPTSSLYKYELKEKNAGKGSDVHIADPKEIRRRKGSYNREKNKLFLKQNVEPQGNGIGIKKSVLESHDIENMKFEKIFAGPAPKFEVRGKGAAQNGKKVRQETLAKFLSKNNIMLPKTDEEKEAAAMKQKKKELEKEKKLQERELKKQRDIEISLKLKDWHNPINDLLLEDHKVLPVPAPIMSTIPDKYMGDVLCVMEFAHAFSTILNLRTYFPQGINLSAMERILFETRVGSPMLRMVQMLLAALFKLEAAEKENYNKNVGGRWGASKETLAADRCQLWLLKNYGSSLFGIEMDQDIISEVLRLHLLAAGHNINEVGIKWRSQYRGGYESEEDPAINFRLHNPHILKSLALHHVCQLSLVDKLKLLDCLVSQLLTFKEVRDVIDQNIDEVKENKSKLRSAYANERKRQADSDTQIAQLKKGNVELSADQAREKISEVREAEEKFKSDFEALASSIQAKIYHKANFLGYDRAHRAYFKLHSIPAFAVNQEDHNQGICLPELTQHVPELVGAEKKDIVAYLNKVVDEMNSSDKENEPKQNGVEESKTSTTLAKINELLMCSTDPTSCPVHTISTSAPKWYVIESEDQLEQLQAALNRRGVSEKELAKAIESDGTHLSKIIMRTPSYVTTPAQPMPPRFHKDDNWGYPEKMNANEVLRNTVIDRILDLEDKLFDGYLGGIAKDRDEFRKLVEDNSFDKLDLLTRPRLKWHIDTEDEESKQIAPSDWVDPGQYLDRNVADIESEDSEVESDEILLAQTSMDQKSIKFLAYALAQVALSIKLNFISKPMGQYNPNTKQNKSPRQNAILLWEQSLVNSTSYSQILMHCHVLDNHIAWSKSTQMVKCKVCKRGTNEQNILLCDYCNDGYHMHCLRPKLTSVPEGNWYCHPCKEMIEAEEAKKKQKEEEQNRMEVESDDGEPHNCVVCGAEETDDSLQCTTCLNVYHLECTNLKRAVRGAWTCTKCKETSERETAQALNGDQMQRRSGRSNETNVDLPLNNAALQELLRDVINHDDAWPFIKPVHKHEVPDYYDIIKKPIDFGTIKYKLNMGDYQYDDEVLSDCQLVFENCHTYNSSGDEVYQCGCRLLKYFVKKCKDLKLDFEVSITMENGVNDEETSEPPRKSRRTR